MQVAELLAEATVRFLARHPLPGIVRSMEHLRCFPVAELHETAHKKFWSVSGA